MKREISASRLQEALKCLAQFFHTMESKREEEVNPFEVIGDATHMLAAGVEPAVARRFVERKLAQRPAAERQDALAKAITMSEIAERSKEPELTADGIERQLIWEFNGWKIFGKPDRIFKSHEVRRDGTEGELLEIHELKTSERAKRWHWDQLFLFGTIASEVLDYHESIKLVVIPLAYVARVIREKREELGMTVEELSANAGIKKEVLEAIEESKCLVSDEQAEKLAKAFSMTVSDFNEMLSSGGEVKWYSKFRTEETKQQIAETLAAIEEAWKTREFPQTTGPHCFGCKARDKCPLGQEFVASRLAEQAARRSESTDDDDALLPVATIIGVTTAVA